MKIRLEMIVILMSVGSCFIASPAWSTEVSHSEAVDRTRLELTVYNHDLALVRESRTVTIAAGESYLEFRDVPSRIEPRSLLVDRIKGSDFHLLEQNYEFDLISRAKIMEKYVGRDVAWLQEDGRRVVGRLLGMNQGPVYQVDGEIVFEVPGRLALPALPNDLRARPTLVWRLKADKQGPRDLDVSYLSGGLSWSADYVLQLDDAGDQADIQAWVSVENRSGTAFEDASLMLLAGDIHRVQAEFTRGGRKGDVMMAMEAPSSMMTEAVGDYHLYTVPGTTRLKDQEIKQISMFTADSVPVKKRYRLLGQGAYVFQGRGAPENREKISVYYELINERVGGLGMPLPAGTFRVYGRSSSGSRQLLGEDHIDHTPKDEKVRLHTGEAFDLVASRKRLEWLKRGKNTHETLWEIELRNRSEKDVVIEVIESVGGEWSFLETSHDPQKIDMGTVRFDVPVSAGKTSTLRYRLLASY